MSSYSKKTFIIFLDLPRRVQALVDNIRKKYSPNAHKKWHSHITLKQDEDYNLTILDLIKAIDFLLKKEKIISIKIHKPKIIYSNRGWNIYMPVTSPKLRQLIRRVSKKLERYIDPYSPNAFNSTRWEQSKEYYPHISLKGGVDKDEAVRTYNLLSKENFRLIFPFKTKCRTITLAKWDRDKWIKVKTYKLG